MNIASYVGPNRIAIDAFRNRATAKAINEGSMAGRIKAFCAPLLAMLVVFCVGSGAIAEDAVWRVAKSSGDASVTIAGGQSALTEGAIVNPGDNIRTGQTGRVLLKRGEETILISPNSEISIPAEKKSGLSTTILQRAGSILLDVEKRNVKHFTVETPYLAAVVKGTQFRVTVNQNDSRVDVLRGQVEVQDFKSGQYAMVLPNQAATVSTQGSAGLLLSGSGTLNPVRQGARRSASVSPVLAANDIPPTVSAQGPAGLLPGGSGASNPIQQGAPRGASMSAAPVVNENRPAVAAQGGSPARIAAASMDTPARTRTPESSSRESRWTSTVGSFGKGLFGSDGRGNRHEDTILAVALSCAIGFFVSVAVATLRRRKSRKLAKG